MNKHKLSILGLSLMILITSCRKVDVQQDKQAAVPAAAVATTKEATSSKVSAWQTVTGWKSNKEEKYTAFSTTISDNALTSATIANGLVLVYMKSGDNTIALPSQEKGSNKYWYYQASEGQLTINCDVYGTNQQIGQAPDIKYFVISEQQINELETAGKSKMNLIGLSYNDALTTLKK